MWVALRRLGTRDLSRLPVLEAEGSRTLVGVVRRSDIVRAYNQAIVKRAHQQHRADVLRLGKLDDTAFVHLDIPAQAPAVGRPISQIDLPEKCLIVSVRRGRKLYVAHGNTVLQAGDRVTVFAGRDCTPLVRQRLTGKDGRDEVHW
jgi:CIC family chloride channel protein